MRTFGIGRFRSSGIFQSCPFRVTLSLEFKLYSSTAFGLFNLALLSLLAWAECSFCQSFQIIKASVAWTELAGILMQSVESMLKILILVLITFPNDGNIITRMAAAYIRFKVATLELHNWINKHSFCLDLQQLISQACMIQVGFHSLIAHRKGCPTLRQWERTPFRRVLKRVFKHPGHELGTS